MAKSDAIFIIGPGNRLDRAPYEAYTSEGALQELIAAHPDLLGSEEMDPDNPPRWLLISREAGVPDEELASDRWSADHLLLDQHGVPTIVEVKRSTDTRIRREVVGQMLDYAANATRYWPVDRIRALAAEQCGGLHELDRRLGDLLDVDVADDDVPDIEAFWTTVEENLRSGRVRLLFVADELPSELRRVIEFLNEQMERVQVLGVEVRQYVGATAKAIVPRVIGQTERTRESKRRTAAPGRTDRVGFLAACPEWSHGLFADLLDTAESKGLLASWGMKGFGVKGARANGARVTLLYGYPPGTYGWEAPIVEVYLRDLDPTESPAGIRERIPRLGGFIAGGKHTWRLALAPDNLDLVRKGLGIIWDAYRELGQADSPDKGD